MIELKELMKTLEKRAGELYKIYSVYFKDDSEIWLQIAQDEAEHHDYIENFFNTGKFSFSKSNIADLKNSVSFVENLIEKYSNNIPDMQEAYENAFKIENFAFEYHISKKIKSVKEELNADTDVFGKLKEADSGHMYKILTLLKKYYLGSRPNFENLFKIALHLEKIARQIYLEFSLKFIENKEVSDFFEMMAGQEEGHYNFLKSMIEKSDPADLNEEVDIYQAVKSYLNLLEILYSEIPEIKSIKEALELAHEIENSEINTIFSIVVERFVDAKDRKELLYKQIILHNQALIEFSGKARRENFLFE